MGNLLLFFLDPPGFFPDEGFGRFPAETRMSLDGDPTILIDTEIDVPDVASTDQGKVDFIVFVDNMEFHKRIVTNEPYGK